jgi:hypothetical protein
MSPNSKLIIRQAVIITMAVASGIIGTTIYDLHSVCHLGYIRAATLLLLCNTDGFTYQ